MAIKPTIIPQKIDLSKSVDGVTIDFKKVLGSDSEDLKLQLAKAFLKDIAEHNLRITSLEVNAGISGADDEISDIFETAEGIKNTVDTTNTTSVYDSSNKVYMNPGYPGTTLTYANTHGTGSGTIVTATDEITFTNIGTKPLQIYRIYIKKLESGSNVTYTIKDTNNTVIETKTITATSQFMTIELDNPYEFLPNQQTTVHITATYFAKYYGCNREYDSNILQVTAQGYDPITIYFHQAELTNPSEKKIYINYDKPTPQAVYLALYSGAFQEDEIGEVYFYFTDGTNNSILMRPWTIYNNLNLSFTPTHMVIVQKDTAVSKISKYVLLIAY